MSEEGRGATFTVVLPRYVVPVTQKHGDSVSPRTTDAPYGVDA